jgi:hypothetical protein
LSTNKCRWKSMGEHHRNIDRIFWRCTESVEIHHNADGNCWPCSYVKTLPRSTQHIDE